MSYLADVNLISEQLCYLFSQRFFSTNAEDLGCLFLMNTPFLLPLTRMMPSVVWKSAKFHVSSPVMKS